MSKLTGISLCIFLLLAPARQASAEYDWYMVLYSGVFADVDMAQMLYFQDAPDFHTTSFDNYKTTIISVLAVGKEFARTGKYIGWEAEAQVGRHVGYQHHTEFNALILARWLPFPWDKYVDTSFAVGEGLSIATDNPQVEKGEHPGAISDTPQTLNYVAVELALGLPSLPHWNLVGRIHHRSNVFGLFGGDWNVGSTFFCAGVKYTF